MPTLHKIGHLIRNFRKALDVGCSSWMRIYEYGQSSTGADFLLRLPLTARSDNCTNLAELWK
jgi:hypothetical protein